MVDQIIRPADLPNRASPNASEKIPVDNGSNVAGATVESIVLAGRPTASQAEAEAGTDAVKAMTPLTTDQKIEYEIGRSVASKAQGDKADTAIQEIIEGPNTTVDNTDPNRPVISSSGNPSVGFKTDIVVVDGQTDWRVARNYKTVPDLLSDDGSGDMGMGYAGSGANVIVAPGDIITAQGFRYEVAASDAADAHVETVGGVKLFVKPSGRYVQPAMFGVADDGDQDADVTAPLQTMATYCRAERRGVKFGRRKYRTSLTLQFNAHVVGGGIDEDGTLIQFTASPTEPALAVVWIVGTSIENMVIDGNVSADPDTWTSANYDSFTGGQCLRVRGNDVLVRNVVCQNSRRAGVDIANAERVLVENVATNRTRGKFGDGFVAMTSKSVTFRNCKAYDFTRIGFVSDIYGDPGTFTSSIKYVNCYAEYGHDASILVGDTEYNTGFWAENSGLVSYENCHARNMPHDGFRMVAGRAVYGVDRALYSARNCSTNDVRGSGYVVQGHEDIPVSADLTTCAYDGTGSTGFSFVSSKARDRVTMTNCSSVLRGTSNLRSSVKLGPGEVIINGFDETWAVLNTTYRDASDNYYGSVSHFSNAPGKCAVSDWNTYDVGGSHIPSVFKFLAQARPSLELSLERCFVRGITADCKDFITDDCIFETLGVIRFNRKLHIKGGTILRGFNAMYIQSTSEEVLVEGALLDFTASGTYLGFFNEGSSAASIKARVQGCKIRKNFEADGYAVRMNGSGGVINTTGANHVVLNACVIENTGSATSNPIVQIDSSTAGASKVMGFGNLKSSSLSVIAKSGHVSASSQFADIS